LRVKIEGFQIIKKCELETEGLTFIVGPTNSGKSSVFRAIEGAIFNLAGTGFVNTDKKKAVVEVTFKAEDNYPETTIKWTKTETGTTFEIDGKLYTKPGKSSPDIIQEELGFQEIEIVKDKERLWFWKQMSEPFLIWQSPGYCFAFISKILEERRYLPALKQMDTDLKEQKKLASNLEGQLIGLREGLRVNKETYNLKSKEVADVEPIIEGIQKGSVALRDLVKFHEDLFTLDVNIKMNTDRKDCISKSVDNVKALVDEISTLTDNLTGLENIASKLSSVESSSRQINNRIGKLKSASDLLSKFNGVNINSYDELVRFQGHLKELMETLDGQRLGLTETKRKKDEAERAFLEFKKELDFCPLCESTLEHTH